MLIDTSKRTPITKKWLEAMGFVERRQGRSATNVYYASRESITVIFWTKGQGQYCSVTTDDCEHFVKTIESLQCLWFALTGKELVA